LSSKGILLFARNNTEIDYIKQAKFLAQRAKEYLDLPVSIVTDTANTDLDGFDKVITVSSDENNVKSFYDGQNYKSNIQWKNSLRTQAYNLTPYDETLLLDTDIVICNSNFAECFDNFEDFQIYKNSIDLVDRETDLEFLRLADSGIDFYWATCVFFRKTAVNKLFFDLLIHIEQNWDHYVKAYGILTSNFRNDYVFSIGIHIINGFKPGSFAKSLPGKLYHITDKSVLKEIKNEELLLLLEDPTDTQNNTLLRTKGINVHAMNKFSLNRCIDEQ